MSRRSPGSDSATGYALSDATQVKMLRKLMLYWDGQWFLKAVEAFGLEEAIGLNARVRTSFGRIEMRTLLKALGKSQANDLRDAMRLLDTYGAAFMGGTLRAKFTALSSDQAKVTVRRCAAFEGAKRAELGRVDQACVACETLWHAWLETLLPGTGLEIEVPKRQGKGAPTCQFLIRITEQNTGGCTR